MNLRPSIHSTPKSILRFYENYLERLYVDACKDCVIDGNYYSNFDNKLEAIRFSVSTITKETKTETLDSLDEIIASPL